MATQTASIVQENKLPFSAATNHPFCHIICRFLFCWGLTPSSRRASSPSLLHQSSPWPATWTWSSPSPYLLTSTRQRTMMATRSMSATIIRTGRGSRGGQRTLRQKPLEANRGQRAGWWWWWWYWRMRPNVGGKGKGGEVAPKNTTINLLGFRKRKRNSLSLYPSLSFSLSLSLFLERDRQLSYFLFQCRERQ